jgi:hypothetical protein
MLHSLLRNRSNPNSVASPTPMIGILGLSTSVIFISGGSPNIPIIGVGEATLLGFDRFLSKECNIPFDLWSKECDATIKLGTVFTDWFGDGLNIWNLF